MSEVVIESDAWRDMAECRLLEPDAFIPIHVEAPGPKQRREERAKKVCAQCAVRAECLEFAIDTEQPDGVWGGKNEIERYDIIRKRRWESL